MLGPKFLPPRLRRALALTCVAGAAAATGACDDADPQGPADTDVLAPAGTGEGTNVGEIEDPIDDDVTGGDPGSTG